MAYIPSHPQHDADLVDDDPYPWAGSRYADRAECDDCGRTSCFCDIDPDGDFEDGFEDDEAFFAAIDRLEEPDFSEQDSAEVPW